MGTTEGMAEDPKSQSKLDELRELYSALLADQGKQPSKEVSVHELKVQADIEDLQAHTEGSKHYYTLRDRWSAYLMVILAVSLVFQGILVVLVGCGVLPFNGNSVFLNSVAGEVFPSNRRRMCYIAVRCLFSR